MESLVSFISAPLRWEHALRNVIGLFLPFAIGLGGFYKVNRLSFLIPILYQIFFVLTPPFYGGAALIIVISLPFTYLAMGIFSLGATYSFQHPGEVWPSFVTLVTFWAIVIPPLRCMKSSLGNVVMMTLVLGGAYIYLDTLELVIYGRVYGIPKSTIDAIITTEHKIITDICTSANSTSPGPSTHLPDDFQAIIQAIIEMLCRQATDPNVLFMVKKLISSGRACLSFNFYGPKLRNAVEMLSPFRDFNYIYDILEPYKPEICLEDAPQVVFVTVTPGPWILEGMWNYPNQSLAVVHSLVEAMCIAAACVALARVLPPGRVALAELRHQLNCECKSLSRMLERQASTQPEDEHALTDIDGRFDGYATLCSLTMLELNFHLGTCVWPVLLKSVVPACRTLADKIGYAQLAVADMTTQSEARKLETDEAQLMQGLAQARIALLAGCARSITYTPLPVLVALDDLAVLRSELEDRAKDVREAAAAAQAAPQLHLWQCAVADEPVTEAALAFAEACIQMLDAQAHPSLKGVLLTIAAFALPPLLAFAEIFKFWILLPLHAVRARWRGELAWWWDYRLHSTVRALLAFSGTVAIVAYVPDVRNYLNYPVGPLPYGALGAWAILPVVLVLLHSVDGTIGKGSLRIIGTLVGAALGYAAATALVDQSTPYLGYFICMAICFAFTFLGVDGSGRIGVFGMFNGQWGYALMLTTYTTMILGIEGDKDQERYTVGEFVTIRVIGQLGGIAIAIAVTLLVVPRFARPTMCGLASGSFREMGRAMRAMQTGGEAVLATSMPTFSELRLRLGPLQPESKMLLDTQAGDAMDAVLTLLTQAELCLQAMVDAFTHGEHSQKDASTTPPPAKSEAEVAAIEACASLLGCAADYVSVVYVRGRKTSTLLYCRSHDESERERALQYAASLAAKAAVAALVEGRSKRATDADTASAAMAIRTQTAICALACAVKRMLSSVRSGRDASLNQGATSTVVELQSMIVSVEKVAPAT